MNLDFVKAVTPHDVIDIAQLLPLAEKAIADEEYLSTIYAYLEEGDCIEVYHHDTGSDNQSNPEVEYITRKDGILHWEVHHDQIDFDLTIDRDDIFNLYKSNYLLQEGCPSFEENGKDFSNEKTLSTVASFFNDFVESHQ